MAEMDMGLSPNNNNKKKRKKKKQSLGESLRTGLLPCKGDSSSEEIGRASCRERV